ncbi:MAG: hypothetical protein K9I34_07425, partial [Bacteroidales bacterium]|nr:hypothetical protein [Bacteroidales bacterium]
SNKTIKIYLKNLSKKVLTLEYLGYVTLNLTSDLNEITKMNWPEKIAVSFRDAFEQALGVRDCSGKPGAGHSIPLSGWIVALPARTWNEKPDPKGNAQKNVDLSRIAPLSGFRSAQLIRLFVDCLKN